jgi:endonuclease/exonuclease/phosphatase family metal-dependent hydrolase
MSRLAFAVCLATACLCFGPSDASAAEPLRVLCYNIHHGEGVDGKLDVERIAAVIRSASPDVAALQEVDQNTRRTAHVDQAAELARLTQMRVVFGKNIDFERGGYGNAVLSKLPINSHANHHLPTYDNFEQRGVLVVELEAPHAKEPIFLFATHLDHRQDDRERLASAAKINELLARHGDAPALLVGDLNDTRESATLEILRREWTQANQEESLTVPVAQPNRQIDFVLLRPASRWKVIEFRVLEEAVASDHRAILAVLELQASPPAAHNR